MWHILKLDYESPAGSTPQTKLIGYNSLANAQAIFDRLELGYQLGQPIRVQGGKMIKVTGASLYESFKDHIGDAEAHVTAGDATVIREAREVRIDLGP